MHKNRIADLYNALILFKRMLEDVEDDKVSTIIVKDLGKTKNEPLFSHMDILLLLFHDDYHSNFKVLKQKGSYKSHQTGHSNLCL